MSTYYRSSFYVTTRFRIGIAKEYSPPTLIVTVFPSTVGGITPSDKLALHTVPFKTWYVKTSKQKRTRFQGELRDRELNKTNNQFF